ncbi:caspase family protein [Shinella sp.]|uniref:caspase family protein n=1 Tax=Shinella sp. TaxID=1870904 RepID=UPI003F721946
MTGSGTRLHVLMMAAVCTVLVLLGAGSASAQPSFDCAKASNAVEHAICGDPTLAALDAEMAAVYSQQRSAAEGKAAEKLVADQRAWMRKRSRCRGDTTCLATQMRERIAELRQMPATQTVALACPEALNEARAMVAGIQFTIGMTQKLTPGTGFLLGYQLRAAKPAPLPLFIVADFPVATRFKGKGFLPLTAGAKGPDGLKHAGERTRAIIPLHGRMPAASGAITVFLLSAGAQDIGVSLVTGGACGEHVLRTERSPRLTVELGLPEIVVQDRFTSDAPDEVLADASGRYEMKVYKDRYDVFDREMGALLFSRAGLQPRFSPTGRFVAAVRSIDRRLEVIDLADGAVVQNLRHGLLAWARSDSFIVLGAEIRQMENSVASTLNADIGTGTYMRNMGVGWRTEIVLDVDRMFAAMTGPSADGTKDGGRFWDIVSGEVYDLAESGPGYYLSASQGNFDDFDPDGARKALRQLVRTHRGFDIPLEKHLWRFGEPIRVTHGMESYLINAYAPDEQLFVPVEKLVRKPLREGTAVVASDDRCGNAGDGRGLARAEGGVFCAVQIAGRGLGRLPQSSFQPSEATVFDRIGAVIGAIDRVSSVAHSTYGHYMDVNADRKAKIDALIDAVARTAPAIRKRFSTVAPENVAFECKTSAEAFDPASIEQAWRWGEGEQAHALLFASCYAGSSRVSMAGLILVSPDLIVNIDRELVPEGASDDVSAFGWSSTDASEIRVFAVREDRILVSASYIGQAAFIDTRTGKRVGNLVPLADPTLVRAMRLTRDSRFLVQLNHDGRFAVFRAETGERILGGAHIDDEIVVMLPDGRFDTTYEGAHALNVRFAGMPALQTVHQFGAALHRPGLAQAVLEGREIAARPETLGSPPLVSFTASVAEAGKRRLAVSATDDTGLARLRVFVDGRLITERNVQGQAAEEVFEITDPGGSRWITVLADDADGLVSTPKGLLLPPPSRGQGRLRAVLVGIDAYAGDPGIPALSFARSDAERLKAVLAGVGGHRAALPELTVLSDRAATREAILKAVADAVAATGPDDTLLFSFAGHAVGSGGTGTTGDLLLALPDTRTGALRETALAWSDVAAGLSKAKGTVVILLDACHTGLAGSSAFATNDDVAGALLTSAGAPMVVLAASKGRQVALESAGKGGGVFTSAIVEVLGTGRGTADVDANGVIDLGEFYSAVKSRVLRDTQGRQSPWLARNLLVGDMSLF